MDDKVMNAFLYQVIMKQIWKTSMASGWRSDGDAEIRTGSCLHHNAPSHSILFGSNCCLCLSVCTLKDHYEMSLVYVTTEDI